MRNKINSLFRATSVKSDICPHPPSSLHFHHHHHHEEYHHHRHLLISPPPTPSLSRTFSSASIQSQPHYRVSSLFSLYDIRIIFTIIMMMMLRGIKKRMRITTNIAAVLCSMLMLCLCLFVCLCMCSSSHLQHVDVVCMCVCVHVDVCVSAHHPTCSMSMLCVYVLTFQLTAC